MSTLQATPSSSRPRSSVPSPTASESGSSTAQHSRSYVPSAAQSTALAHYLQTQFLPSVLPTHAEYAEKEQVRLRLESLANNVLPGARLLPFGSTANGLSLRNSDMDLCCVLDATPDASKRPPSELVEILGEAIQRAEATIYVKMLPRARIPIIKLTLPPSPDAPFGIQCDIGFENRLALENTRLLLTYALTDTRLRTMVLFIKVWTKRRKINNPYVGTLSSYGFVLMVIYYLMHVRRPAVLPNLQRIPPTHNVPLDDMEIEGYDIYFFDDVEALSQMWNTANTDNVGELLIGFFHFFAKLFDYSTRVISIRSESGSMPKSVKGWHSDRDAEIEMYGGPRELNRFCIEDPFQTEYNVARTVTRDGLYTIRGELMRACKMLCGRSEIMGSIISELCEEREDTVIQCPPGASSTGGRRKSAPSPRGSAAALPTDPASAQATEFRAWVQANAPAGTLQSATPLPGATPYVQRMPFYPNGPAAGPSDYMQNPQQAGYRNQYRPYRGQHQQHHQTYQHSYPQQQQQQTQRYFAPRATAHNLNVPQYSQQPYSSPRMPVLERRSSWDGAHQSSPQPAQAQPVPVRPAGAYGVSPVRPSQTAPTSPTMGPLPYPPRYAGPMYGSSSARSHSHSSLDRRQMPLPPFQPVPRPLESISFGNFNSNMINVMDTALARAEDRRRRGMQHVDNEHETITFGDVRVYRRARAESPPPDAHAAGASPRKGTALPQVLEAIEVNRPNTPGVPSVTTISPPPPPSLPSPRSLVNGHAQPSLSEQMSRLSTEDGRGQ